LRYRLESNGRLSVVVAPPPLITSVALSSGQITFGWTAVTGLTYLVEYKTDLAQTNWNPVAGGITATTDTLFMTNSISDDPQSFFRVVLP
jgi:hypothetical protein